MTPQTGHAGHSVSAGENSRESLVTVDELADFLGVGRDYVYEHAVELGAWRLGTGPRARLRFDLAEVRRRLTSCPAGRESEAEQTRMVEPKRRRARVAASGSGVELLPIRGSVVPLKDGRS